MSFFTVAEYDFRHKRTTALAKFFLFTTRTGVTHLVSKTFECIYRTSTKPKAFNRRFLNIGENPTDSLRSFSKEPDNILCIGDYAVRRLKDIVTDAVCGRQFCHIAAKQIV